MVVWDPRFKVHDCISWGDYSNLCITDVNVNKDKGGGGTYRFEDNGKFVGVMWGPSIDDGFGEIKPAEKLTLGGKRRRSKSSKKRKSTKKSRKNRRKSKRRGF